MQELLPSLFVAVVIFATTDLDNIVVLTVFFADPAMRVRSVVLGQFLGSGALVLCSVLSAILALTVPPAWIALLGIVPIILSVRGFIRLYRRRTESDPDKPAQQEHRLQARTHSQMLAVTLVTMAHGADNLGIYIPLFARSPGKIPLYATVFAVMMTCSLFLGHALVKNRMAGDRIKRYGHIVIPFVLLGLGLHILWGARPLLPF